MKMKYTGDLGGDYKENKEVFKRLKDVAKELKLTEIDESFNEDDENIVIGYLPESNRKGFVSEVTIREVENDNP